MLPLLGKTRVINDPRLDRSVAFDRRQHKLPHLAQDLFIAPRCDPDKIQQRLVLRRCPRRSRPGRHRLHTLALARKDQAYAIITQWPDPVRAPDDTRKPRSEE